MLSVVGNCLIDVFGGIAAAAIVATAGWHAFKLVRIPELGPWAALIAVVALPGAMRSSFVQMMILFLAIAALVLTGEGRAWRRRRRSDRILKMLKAEAKPTQRPGLHPFS
jgi:chromate transport protein ChrA